ncbi:hypothetical protein, partial [Dyella jejuensis]
ADSQPPVGMVLNIPQVTTSANASNTFQPYAASLLANGSASACETTAQIVAASVEAVLNQQSALAQTVKQVEQQQAQAAVQQQQAQLEALAEAIQKNFGVSTGGPISYSQAQRTLSNYYMVSTDAAIKMAQAKASYGLGAGDDLDSSFAPGEYLDDGYDTAITGDTSAGDDDDFGDEGLGGDLGDTTPSLDDLLSQFGIPAQPL